MAGVTCTVNGKASNWNNLWYPSSGYHPVTGSSVYVGGTAYYVMQFTVPYTEGSFTSSSFTVSTNIIRTYNGATSATYNWGISTVGRDSTVPPSMLWQGTWNISGLTYQNQKFTNTTGAINLGSGTTLSGTYYLWIWGGKIAEVYPTDTSYFGATLNYTDVTAVGAPTTVKSTARIGRGKTTYISWSGASAGASNSITGYRIYYAINAIPDGSSSYWTVYTSNTYGSFTTSALSTVQGRVYYFRVMTMGGAGGSYYSALSGQIPSTTINTTPTVSAFSTTTPVVSSRGSKNITFNITRADANSDLISAKFYIIKGGVYTYLDVTTNTSISLPLDTVLLPENTSTTGADVDYQFAVRVTDAYDNWDYYSEKRLTITRKAKPVISSIAVTAANTPSYRTLTDNNTLPFCTLVNATMTKYGTAESIGWRIRASNSTSFSGNGVSISSSTALSSFNVTSYVGFGQYYQIGLRIYSGYEYSDIVWKTSGYTSGSRTAVGFYMAPAIEIIAKSNKSSVIDSFNPALLTYTNSNPNDFSSEITLSHTYNSLYTVTYWWNKVDGNTGGTQIDSNKIGTYGVNLSFPSSITAFNVDIRTQFYLYIQTSYSNITNVSSTINMTKIITNPLSNTILTDSIGESVKPTHTNATSSYDLTFTQFWGTNNLATYYDMPTDWTNFSLHLSVASQTKIIHQGGPGNIPGVLSNDTRTWPFTGTQLYDWTTNSLGLTFSTDYTASLQLRVTDYFNNTYTVSSSGFTFSLKEAPLFTTTAGAKIEYDKGKGDTLININQDTIVNEGYKLSFTLPTAKAYEDTNLIYTLYISRNVNRIVDLSVADYVVYETLPPTSLQNAVIKFDHIVNSITDPMYCYFKVEAVDPFGQKAIFYYNNYTIISGKLQMIPPANFALMNGAIDSTQTVFNFSYILDNVGGGLRTNSLSYSNFDNGYGLVQVDIEYSFDGQNFTLFPTPILKATNFTQIANAIQAGVRAANFTLEQVTASFIYIRLKTTAKVFTDITSEIIEIPSYITYTNILAIPNIQPTVAYRKGYLGINNSSFEEDDVLVINVAPGTSVNGRHIIKYMSGGWEGTINLITGEIDGFTIQGGTWE